MTCLIFLLMAATHSLAELSEKLPLAFPAKMIILMID